MSENPHDIQLQLLLLLLLPLVYCYCCSTFFGIMMNEGRVLLSFELDGKRSLQMLCRVNKTIYEERHKFMKAL